MESFTLCTAGLYCDDGNFERNLLAFLRSFLVITVLYSLVSALLCAFAPPVAGDIDSRVAKAAAARIFAFLIFDFQLDDAKIQHKWCQTKEAGFLAGFL